MYWVAVTVEPSRVRIRATRERAEADAAELAAAGVEVEVREYRTWREAAQALAVEVAR
jgi:hypothetical protein